MSAYSQCYRYRDVSMNAVQNDLYDKEEMYIVIQINTSRLTFVYANTPTLVRLNVSENVFPANLNALRFNSVSTLS